MSFAKIRPRRGTALQWTTANPVLAEGEIGIEVPNNGVGTGFVKVKFGDGVTPWNELPYGLKGDIVQNLEVDSPDMVPSVSAVKKAIDEVNSNLSQLQNNLDNLKSVSAYNGFFDALVQNGEAWFIMTNRISVSSCCVCIVSRHADVMSVCEIRKDNGFTIDYNNQGTVSIIYDGSGAGVLARAIKI